jgi:hypothetical protein
MAGAGRWSSTRLGKPKLEELPDRVGRWDNLHNDELHLHHELTQFPSYPIAKQQNPLIQHVVEVTAIRHP